MIDAPSRSVTVVEVAQEAGVSVGTVSRFLNGYRNLSADNLKRVEQAIDSLGYQPRRSSQNSTAQASRGAQRTGNIGVIYAESSDEWKSNPLYAEYSRGVSRACSSRGYHFLVEWKRNDEIPSCVREGKVDGLLVKAISSAPGFLNKLPASFPVLCVGLNDPSVELSQVSTDDFGAGWSVAKYLWEQGHRRIAFLSENAYHVHFLARYLGYEKFMRQKAAFDPECVVLEDRRGTGKPTSAPPEMGHLLERILDKGVTAVVLPNDWMACGLYRALAKYNLRVPQDLSVVGFDNVKEICESMSPSLTSYAVPFSKVAQEGALALINRIENSLISTGHSVHLVRGELVERQSVMNLVGSV